MEEKTLRFENVFLRLPNRNGSLKEKHVELISGVSGEIVSGRLTAVMGGSGSSKTSFLNLLMGKVDSNALTSGIVTLNGRQREGHRWVGSASYLEQFDVFSPGLTVEESIRYSLVFRGREIKDSSIPLIVDSIIQELDLDRIRGTLISSISGGERRRVMLAVELAVEPEVVFLDEPTSGLDARLAFDTVRILRKYAQSKNKIVLMTVHQPGNSMFGLFDDIIFLNRGKIVYAGPRLGIDPFLVSKGMERPSGISVAEYLFELNVDALSSPNSPSLNGEMTRRLDDSTLEKGNRCFFVSTISWHHVWHLLARQLKIDYRCGRMRNIFLFKTVAITLLFFFLCSKVKYSVFLFINKVYPEYSAAGEEYVDDLRAFLQGTYEHLGILYSDVFDFFTYCMVPFITCFSIFNDSTFLDNTVLLRKEAFRCDYSQVSLLASTLIYECGFSLIRSGYFCLLLSLTQLRDMLTGRAIMMFTLIPLGMVAFMTMAKALSSGTYPLNIARVGAFVLVTFLRPLWLSRELEDLRTRYGFMEYLYPASYLLFFSPFLLLDALFYVTLGGRGSMSLGFIAFLAKANGLQAARGLSLRGFLNHSITFLNRCYLSEGFLVTLTIFSFVSVLVLSVLFLVLRFSSSVRLTLSTKSLEMELNEVTVN